MNLWVYELSFVNNCLRLEIGHYINVIIIFMDVLLRIIPSVMIRERKVKQYINVRYIFTFTVTKMKNNCRIGLLDSYK